MPTFDFTSPDGKTYSVDGPEGATKEQAFQILQQQVGAQTNAPQQQTGLVDDIVKSAASGLEQGTIGTLGAGGDIRSLGSKAIDYAGEKMGAAPDAVRQFKDTVKAGAQYMPGLRMMMNLPTSEQVKASATQPLVDPDYKSQTVPGEYAKTIASFGPGLVLGGEGNIARQAFNNVLLPAVASETAGQLTKGTAAEPYARLGGALTGPAAVNVARRAITPLPAGAERQALADTLRAEGVPITAGQATGSKPLQWMESALGDTIGSGGPVARTMENQAEQFTSAALRRAGIDANRATPEVIDNAFTRIGNDFETIARRNNMAADQRLNNDLQTTLGEYNNVVSPSNRAPVIENTANDIADMAAQNGGHLTGEQYNAITSRLARQARNARADAQLQEGLHGLRNALDDAMERSMFRAGNADDLALLRQARNQYRNMIVLERAATGAGSNAAEGFISPSQLRNAVVQQNRRAYGRGHGDFADLARAGEALLKPLPQSGTSPRHNVTNLLHTVGAIVGGGVGSVGGPGGSVGGALAGLAAPAVAGRALMSRPVQAYLGNQTLHGRVGARAEQQLMNLLLASSTLNRPALNPPQ